MQVPIMAMQITSTISEIFNNAKSKRFSYLFQAFLPDGFRINPHFENNGVGLADETPHFQRWQRGKSVNASGKSTIRQSG